MPAASPFAAKIPAATVNAYPLDIPVVTGDKPIPGANPGTTLGKVHGPLVMRMQPSRLKQVEVQRPVEDGAACFGHGSVITGKANVTFRRWVEEQAA